jgi:hypothetical protein
MSISSKIGKVSGKLVSATKSAPGTTGSKLKNIKDELAAGYREVVPTKIKDQEENS